MSYNAVLKALQMQLTQRYEFHPEKYNPYIIKDLESTDDEIYAMDHYIVNRMLESLKVLGILSILNDRIINSGIGMKKLSAKKEGEEFVEIYKQPTDKRKLFSEEDIKIAEEFAKMKINLVSVGFGGVSSNVFSYWSLLSDVIDKPLFNKVIVFEKDTMEFHNLLRMPIMDPNKIPIRKIDLVDQFTNVAEELIKVPKFLEEEDVEQLSKDFLFTGAPNLATRIYLAKKGANALFTTNMNRKFFLIPGEEYVSNNDLITETYGKLHLGIFGVGNFTLALEFMKYLLENRSGIQTIELEPIPLPENSELPGIGYFEINNIKVYV